MCNAWNHSAACTCGWGGEGHLGRRAAFPAATHLFLASPLGRSAASFTVPNTRCPVCGASVFFYSSPHGGRVYFDELGPPWPKHPCTDTGVRRGPRSATARKPTAALAPAPPAWQLDGWTPFIVDDIRDYSPELFRVGGDWQGHRVVVYLPRKGLRLEGDALDFWPDGLWQLRELGERLQASIWSAALSPGIRRVFRSTVDAHDALVRVRRLESGLTP